MQLDNSQKQTVTAWLEQGLGLSEIQKRLAADLGLKLTYMEVRLLLADLNLTPQDQEPPVPPDKPAVPSPGPGAAAAPVGPGGTPTAAPAPPAADGTGRVSLTVDQVTRPGCLASGQVTFSDGQAGEWYMDQMGRLGVAPKLKGYRPSPQDVQEFQLALESQLARLGL